MNDLLQDARVAARALAKQPGFIAAAALTLGLGVGANTAVFSFVSSLMLKPLPFHDADRLVAIKEERRQGVPMMTVTPGDYTEWQAGNTAFEQLTAYQYRDCNIGAAASATGEGEHVFGVAVPANYFRTLQVAPVRGREFLQEEMQAGREDAVILGNNLWSRHFGADPAILGKRIFINERAYTVVGIMPADFEFPIAVDLWMPLALTPEERRDHRNHTTVSFGRLRAGVSMAQADADLRPISARLEREFPLTNTGRRLRIVPLRKQQGDFIDPFLILLQVAALFVLVIACTNVANMQLARATARAKEVAIRVALGAGRWRVVRLLLVESIALSLAGGIVGVVLALWGVGAIRRSVPVTISRYIQGWKYIQVDWATLIFTFLLALAAGILFGLSAAVQPARRSLAGELREGNRGGPSRAQGYFRSLLVVSEVALALVMVVVAGQMREGFQALFDSYQGFSPDRVVTFRMNLPEASYAQPQQVRAFHDDLLRRLTALAGVESAALVSNLPGGMRLNASAEFRKEGAPEPAPGQAPLADLQTAGRDYFRTLEIHLLEGRAFGFQDGAEAPPVAMVSERMARQYWPNESPIGKRVRLVGWSSDSEWRRIVGVVDNVRQTWYERVPQPTLYLPDAQVPRRSAYFLIRGTSQAGNLMGAAKTEVRRLDPNLTIYELKPMRQVIDEAVAAMRVSAGLMGVFGIISLLLSALGVYGVMSYSVAQRTREFGIRMALGAVPGSVLGMVARQALVLAAGGVALGLPVAFLLTRAMHGMIFGLRGVPAGLMTIGALLLGVSALVASWVPARAATKVDPVTSLRCE